MGRFQQQATAHRFEYSSSNELTSVVQAGDADNRLVAMQPVEGTQQEGDRKVAFAYDYLGRRVRKEVQVWDPLLGEDGSWSTDPAKGAYVRKFVWQDWLMLEELEGGTGVPPMDTIVRQYTWGLDLGGLLGSAGVSPASLQSAGGIGGLLAVRAKVDGVPGRQDPVNFVYCHDALGNVGQVVDLAADPNDPNAALVARYEYDPYGNIVGPDDDGDGEVDFAGWFAGPNAMQFSTKYWDNETGSQGVQQNRLWTAP